VGVVRVVESEADLFQVVGALDAAGGFPDLLNGRQQQPDQDRDDGDYHQQLDEREGFTERAHENTSLNERDTEKIGTKPIERREFKYQPPPRHIKLLDVPGLGAPDACAGTLWLRWRTESANQPSPKKTKIVRTKQRYLGEFMSAKVGN